jgi:hypothetical protein
MDSDAFDREWYKIRDTLTGMNRTQQNIPLALKLASASKHPNALWLAEVLKDAPDVLAALRASNDPRAGCLIFLLSDSEDFDALQRAMDLGEPYAQAWMSSFSLGEDKLKLAKASAAQKEREGFRFLAECYHSGEGCDQDLCLARANFLRSAQLSNVHAMVKGL